MARLIAALALIVLYTPVAYAQTVTQDFEQGQGNWFADNGVWEVGTPTFGPSSCHQGTQCAATVLDDQYPMTHSRLVTPPVQLGQGSAQNPLLLRFWHWFQWGGSTGGNPGRGVVQISVYDSMLGTWSAWADVSTFFSSSSTVWTLSAVDLTAFSNELVKIAFYHQGANAFTTGAGWYVDDVEIPGTATPAGAPAAWQDFELGQGDWFADNGVWEVGTPTLGPSACHQGAQCAATILDDQYPMTHSRLVSPPVQMDHASAQNPLALRFWHWFQWGGGTGGNPGRGVVQISVYDSMLDTWSAWTDISPFFSSASGVWTLNIVDLTAFSDELVKIAFDHQGANAFTTGPGWYVDDVEISGAQIQAGPFATWQDFELGQGNWFADNGVWEVGTPTFGPSACQDGIQCAGTILGGQYPMTESRLVSPPMRVPGGGAVTAPLLLRFWHWFQWGGSTGGNPGRGVVQISVYDPMLDMWSAWADISPFFSSASGVWTLNIVDLTAFSNELVKIAFDHQGANAFTTGAGWYVDEIAISSPSATGAYVLDGFGGLHPAGPGGVPITPPPPYFGFDIARDVELSGNGGYVLDGFGGVHTAGGESALVPGPPYFGFDIARDLELASGGGAYVLDGYGGVHAAGGAPLVSPATPYFGFDAARDLEFRGAGYYVLDGWGGLHTGGTAPVMSPAPPYFGFDIAQDLELPKDNGGYVLDGFGGVHSVGAAPVLTPATPYFGFDVARDMELEPGGGGYYVLDAFGGLHIGAGAAAISPAPPYFGFDIARDLEIR